MENHLSFHLRNIQAADAEAIAALSHQLGYPASAGDLQQRITTLISHPDHCVFVAVHQEQVVGWIHGFYSLNLESGPFVAIAGLVVDEHHRRAGIGKALIDKVVEWPLAATCGRVRVRCNSKRTESHRFYQALGFREAKEQKVFEWKI